MSTGRQQPVFSPYPRSDGLGRPLSSEASCNRFLLWQSILPVSISLPSEGDTLFVQNHGRPPAKYCESVANEPADLCVFLLPPNPVRSSPRMVKSRVPRVDQPNAAPWMEEFQKNRFPKTVRLRTGYIAINLKENSYAC